MDVRRKSRARAARVGEELRLVRDQLGLSQKFVAEKTDLDPSTIGAIERGSRVPQKRSVITLLDYYRVRGPQRTRLIALVEKANEPGWVERFDLSAPLADYITWESYAKEAMTYQSVLVPGLLQTPDYTRALFRGEGLAPAVVENLVEVRHERQASSLGREEPLRLVAVMDEAVLHRPIGGPQVMAAQLGALAKDDREHVTIQVVQHAAGAYPGLAGGPFIVLDDYDSSPLACVESVRNTVFFERPEDVRRYLDTFQDLRQMALNPEESRALIGAAARKIKK